MPSRRSEPDAASRASFPAPRAPRRSRCSAGTADRRRRTPCDRRRRRTLARRSSRSRRRARPAAPAQPRWPRELVSRRRGRGALRERDHRNDRVRQRVDAKTGEDLAIRLEALSTGHREVLRERVGGALQVRDPRSQNREPEADDEDAVAEDEAAEGSHGWGGGEAGRGVVRRRRGGGSLTHGVAERGIEGHPFEDSCTRSGAAVPGGAPTVSSTSRLRTRRGRRGTHATAFGRTRGSARLDARRSRTRSRRSRRRSSCRCWSASRSRYPRTRSIGSRRRSSGGGTSARGPGRHAGERDRVDGHRRDRRDVGPAGRPDPAWAARSRPRRAGARSPCGCRAPGAGDESRGRRRGGTAGRPPVLRPRPASHRPGLARRRRPCARPTGSDPRRRFCARQPSPRDRRGRSASRPRDGADEPPATSSTEGSAGIGSPATGAPAAGTETPTAEVSGSETDEAAFAPPSRRP